MNTRGLWLINAQAKRYTVPPRFEAKYMVPRLMLPEVRAFIEPFCRAAPNGIGEQPEYRGTTMQFDARSLTLFEGQYQETLNRFKLRARYYGEAPGDLIFLEIKTRLNDCIVKHRARLPTEHWHDRLFLSTTMPRLPSAKDADARFRRLYHEIDARPVVLVRYTREPYFGRTEKYARVTIDPELIPYGFHFGPKHGDAPFLCRSPAPSSKPSQTGNSRGAETTPSIPAPPSLPTPLASSQLQPGQA